MDVAFNESEDQTYNLTASVKEDITNIFLNPHLVNISQVRYIFSILKVHCYHLYVKIQFSGAILDGWSGPVSH